MLPITTKLKMNPLILPFAVGMAAGVMNPLPWSGPTTRVMAVLQTDASTIFTPIVPAMAVGIAWVLFACYYIGKKERKRLGVMHIDEHTFDGLGEDPEAKRPQLFWFNFILTVIMIIVLLMDIMPMATIFMIGFALALTVNYPNLEEQTNIGIVNSGTHGQLIAAFRSCNQRTAQPCIPDRCLLFRRTACNL